ncbi:MAG: hypothetical protein EOO05_12990 [Chitinophagaceae bacterium]|nr:MAG: hypothetical protein EOO05_12990 [Chitinophagaceae bacterium]
MEPGLGLSASYRYYYNYNARSSKGKRTAMNSLNFVSLLLGGSYTDRPISFDFGNSGSIRFRQQAALLWGLQRNYTSRLAIEFSAGAGVYSGKTGEENAVQGADERVTVIRPMFQFSFGWWLNRKK